MGGTVRVRRFSSTVMLSAGDLPMFRREALTLKLVSAIEINVGVTFTCTGPDYIVRQAKPTSSMPGLRAEKLFAPETGIKVVFRRHVEHLPDCFAHPTSPIRLSRTVSATGPRSSSVIQIPGSG